MSALFDLSGHTALVTGATQGIGFALAEALAGAGAKVIVSGRDRRRAEEAASRLARSGAAVEVAVMDVTDEQAVVDTLGELRRGGHAPDILVNNAGIIDRTPLEASTTERWRTVVETNLVAPYVLSRETARSMRQGGWGRIVNVASILALHGKINAHAYAASKHAVAGLTRALAAELGPDGITANAICPGYIRSDINVSLQRDQAFDAKLIERTPVRRWGECQDLASAIVFLCAPASSFVNGHLLVVDGGFTATH